MLSDQSYLTNHVENNHPAFLIIPFRRDDIFTNARLPRIDKAYLLRRLQERYPGKFVTITQSGREALALALDQNRKSPNDILIRTTSNNFYISSCVTDCIGKQQTWHRDSSRYYDSLLVNHEFGYADNRVLDGIVGCTYWIEDCAFSFDTKYSNGQLCGTMAPYAVFSFSKFFPIQIGGFLLSDEPVRYNENGEAVTYISSVVGHYFDAIESWSRARLEIYSYYSHVFSELGCSAYFQQGHYDIPGVFLFRVADHVDLNALKRFYWKRGVQCSVFYGRQAFFLPLNQFTTRSHVDYFADLFLAFIRE